MARFNTYTTFFQWSIVCNNNVLFCTVCEVLVLLQSMQLPVTLRSLFSIGQIKIAGHLRYAIHV